MGDYEAKYYDFPPIEIGANYDWAVTLQDNAGVVLTGLTGASVTMYISQTPGGIQIDSFGPYMTLTPATGRIVLAMTPTQTGAIKWSKGYYRLILNLLSGAKKVLIYGKISAKAG